LSATLLTFTSANYNTPQTVTVTVNNDNIATGSESFSLTFSVVSADANYMGQAVNPITITLADDDTGDVCARWSLCDSCCFTFVNRFNFVFLFFDYSIGVGIKGCYEH
jgi:hypothetical protein